MQHNDNYFMGEALKEAEKAARKKCWPIGCVVVDQNNIISRAHNLGKDNKNKLKHAEVLALQEVLELSDDKNRSLTLYTTFEPCLMCLGALMIAGVNRVVTGVNLDQSGILDIKPLLSEFYQKPKFSFTVTKGVLAEECAAIFNKN